MNVLSILVLLGLALPGWPSAIPTQMWAPAAETHPEANVGATVLSLADTVREERYTLEIDRREIVEHRLHAALTLTLDDPQIHAGVEVRAREVRIHLFGVRGEVIFRASSRNLDRLRRQHAGNDLTLHRSLPSPGDEP